MPTFEISLDDGRKFQVDAVDQDTALKGIQAHLGQNSQPQSGGGMFDAAKAGAANLLSGFGETGQRYFGVGKGLSDVGNSLQPQNAPDTTLYDDKGFHAENIPNALAAASPSMAAAMAAARLTPGPLWAKLGAAGLVGLGSAAGNYAKEATAKRTGDANAPSNAEDLTAGVVRAAPEAAIQSLPISRFLPAPAARLGMAGVLGSLGRTAVDAGAVGAGGAGANIYDQLNQTGTVDPNQAINAAATGAVTGGAFGAGRLAQDAKAAVKYRALAGEDPAHIAEAANRIQQSNDALNGNLASTSGGYDAMKSAQSDVGNEVKQTVKTLKSGNTLSQDSTNALARVQKGLPLSDDDALTLQTDTNNNSAVQDLQRLSGVARVLQGVQETGHVNEAKGTFTGGISGAMGEHVRALANPLGAGVSGALAASGGAHLGDAFAHSPEALAALTGAYGLARFSDWASGNRSPANAFTSRFADPTVGVPSTSPGLQALAQQAQRMSPTGPKIGQVQSPWGNPPQQAQQPVAGATPPVAPPMANAAPQNPAAQGLATTPPFNAAQLKPAVQAALKARMNVLNMQNAQQAPAEQAAPPTTPDLSGMRGDVQAALKARMNALNMQNAAQAPAPAMAPAPPAKVTKTNGKVQETPAPAPAGVQPIRFAPDATDELVAASRAQRQMMNGIVAKQAAANTGEPAVPATASPPTAPTIPEDLSIPDFLKRTAAPAEPQVQTATKALSKLNGKSPVDLKGEVDHPAEELAMSPKEYSDHRMAQYTPEEKTAMNGKDEVTRASIERKVQWKQDVAVKLASMFPDVGDQKAFYNKLFTTHRAMPVRQLRDALAAQHPEHAQEVNDMLSNDKLRRIWNRVN